MDVKQLGRRSILVLLVAGELAVVGGLGAVAWHVWQQSQAPNPGGPPVSMPAVASPRPSPSATMTVPVGPTVAPTPGLRTDPAFLDQVTIDINREELALEQLEWQIIHGSMDAVRAYIQKVVLPAIARAQREATSR